MKKLFFFILSSCKENESEIERITEIHKIENPEEIKNIPEKVSKNITITEQENYDFSKITKEDLYKISKGSLKEYFKNIFDEKKDKNDIQENFKKLFIEQNKGKDDGRLLFEILSPYIKEGIENKLKIRYQNDSCSETKIDNENILKFLNILQDTKYSLKKIYEEKPIDNDVENCKKIENFIKSAIEDKMIIYIYKNEKNEIEIIFLENMIDSNNKHCHYNLDYFPDKISEFLFIKNKSWIKNGQKKDIGDNKEVENLYEKDLKTLVKNNSKPESEEDIFDGCILEGSKITISKSSYQFRNFFVYKLNYDGNKKTLYENFEKGNCKIVYSRNLA